jgi:hypothetical protein
MRVVDRAFDNPLQIEEQAAGPLAGGIVNYGYQCGMLWGAALAAGAQVYRLRGSGPPAETMAVMVAQNLVKSFRTRTRNEINCLEITDLNLKGKIQAAKLLKFFIKGGPVNCFRMIASYVRAAFSDIDGALAGTPDNDFSLPVSCAALTAQKLGASEKHAVIAAGLAGGIGLSGGGCGALGTAIWLINMNGLEEGIDKKSMDARISQTIDRFLKGAADFKFECSEITGRKFENVGEHTAYLRGGGCSDIIKTLSAG